MKNIIIKQEEIIENFNLLEEWEDKYEYILDFSKKTPIIEQQYKTDEYLVKGCQSKMWLWTKLENNKIYYFADSEAEMPKGLASILIYILSGNKPQDILDTEITFLKDTEVMFHLSPNRVKGINSLIKKMKEVAQNLKK